MNLSVARTAQQINDLTGETFRVSGNLLIRRTCCKTVPLVNVATRGSVTGFSAGSGQRMRRYLRECLPDYKHMVTLTYPGFFSSDGSTSKNHLRRFLQEVQRWDRRSNKDAVATHSSFWFLEFQQRGAPHYHIFLNRCPDKTWVSRRWYEIVGSEDIRHLHAGTRTEKLFAGRAGTISYASKYATKMEQKLAPSGYENLGRFWGVYGSRATLSADVFISRTSLERPEIFRAVKWMEKVIEKGIICGHIEVVKEEDGLILYAMMNSYMCQRFRLMVSSLAWQTCTAFDYFSDAEVDHGRL